MSYSLPKYYFRDLSAEVMDEIMRVMAAVRPEPTWKEIDQWVDTHNKATTIPQWYERAGTLRRRVISCHGSYLHGVRQSCQ